MIIIALAAAAAVTAACPVERAHYSLRHEPNVTMSFVQIPATQDWPSGVAAIIRFKDTGRHYDFLPWNGGTDDRQNFAFTDDVTKPDFHLPSPDGGPGRRGDLEYLATDAQYDIIDHAPTKGEAAPAHILLPGLREVTWYSDSNARDAAGKAFFDLDGCR
jgi:hypothetical protein